VKYRTIFHDKAKDQLRGIEREQAIRILAKLTELETDPHGFSSLALTERPGQRRLRVGNYRVIYMIDHDQLVIWVVEVGHRSTVYDDQ
jgi:mRNA interferase RelE/StbE